MILQRKCWEKILRVIVNKVLVILPVSAEVFLLCYAPVMGIMVLFA